MLGMTKASLQPRKFAKQRPEPPKYHEFSNLTPWCLLDHDTVQKNIKNRQEILVADKKKTTREAQVTRKN